MRKDKDKQKKGGESTIGKIIYGFLLFLPLFAIGVTCGYAMFNKNAYQSFEDSNLISQLVIPTNSNQIIDNQQINFDYYEDTITTQNSTIKFGFKSLSFNPLDYYWDNRNWTHIQFTFNDSHKYIYLFDDIGSYQAKDVWGTQLTSISIISNGNNSDLNRALTLPTLNTSLISFKSQKINNVFYYSIDKVTQSPLFNWTQNSIIYTGIHATCVELNITAVFYPLLLTYWLLISIIYFLYDIVLMLIMIIHCRIHQLEDTLT